MSIQINHTRMDDKCGEECGVIGIYDLEGNDVASSLYYGLFSLQHRGQESCGIAVSDTRGPKRQVRCVKDMGLVHEVFTPEDYLLIYFHFYHIFYHGEQCQGKCTAVGAQLRQGHTGAGTQWKPDQCP